MPPLGPDGLDRQRRRALATYFVAAALTSIGYIAFFTVAAIAAPEITGSKGSSGLPSAAAVAGTAVAAALLSTVMARRGRRIGIVLGIGVGVAGAATAVLAVLTASLLLLLAGSLAIGFGNAAIQLSRYAAADLYPPARRAGALGIVVWGSTIGAVVGPNLISPAGVLAEGQGISPLAGGFAMTVIFVVAALLVSALGPRAPREDEPDPHPEAKAGRTPALQMLADLLRQVRGRTAVLAMGSGQVVMTLIMTMTPLHLHEAGHGLGTVGFVISAHALGMYALAPVSGRLTDRLGASTVITTGFAALAAAGLLAAVAPAESGTALALPLFLLGLGWNLTFVAGSSLLASGASLPDRARLQGVTDALVWTAAALSSIASGYVVELAGYVTLSLLGAGAAVLLAGVIAVDRRTARPAEA
ncbi:MAG TPA: MFS transporter [Candidatus Dormibacteraeota bacterium]|nr:MFS transporter [Candidatus Dormibacteraeota bacterium]